MAPDTHYGDASVLSEWFARARVGASAVYARGCGLNPENPIVRMINGWKDAGHVLTLQQRVDGELRYIVRRRDAALAQDIGAAMRPMSALVEPLERELLDYIVGIASDGLPLPTNGAIAEALNWAGKEQVQYRLNKLVVRGLIEIAAAIPAGARVVRIIDTGRATQGTTVQATEQVRA